MPQAAVRSNIFPVLPMRSPPRKKHPARSATWTGNLPRRNAALMRASFSAMAALVELTVVAGAAIVVWSLYHWLAYGPGTGLTASNLQLDIFVVTVFTLCNAMRGDYSIARHLTLNGHGWRLFAVWTASFLGAAAFGFLTKTTEESSRGAFLLFYVFGFLAAYLARTVLVRHVRANAAAGGVSARRVFLVGAESDIASFTQRYKPSASGMQIVAAIVLRDAQGTLDDDLALAAASARMLRPDDVFILSPWSQTEIIDRCVNAFLRVPAQIHLGPERVLDRFDNAHIDKIGAISSLSLSARALNPTEVLLKRAFDCVGASLALMALSPLLLVVALLIRLDSKGPALFVQRRYGFNREPFRIFKFRSMTTMEDGREIAQATVNDARVTRIGRFIRRYNIDELPQLINVLRGEMSLVGPRPHALAHDQLFERKIALYARRHNVKPGITGWAQVNGLRGEIDSAEKIRQRVEHDLHYIDNWSLLLDGWIIFMTVFSKKAYSNAV